LDEALTERQWRFLKAAQVAAGNANRFRWREVGASLGFDDAESRTIAENLEHRVAIVLPTEHEGQFLPLGRALAQQWMPAKPVRPVSKAKRVHSPPASRERQAGSSSSSRRNTKHGRAADTSRHHSKRQSAKHRSAPGKGK